MSRFEMDSEDFRRTGKNYSKNTKDLDKEEEARELLKKLQIRMCG
jgi:hypothetical protein